MAYRAVASGVPKYFLGMLSDADREAQYKEAIAEMLKDLQGVASPPLRVLDYGCGTGVLGILALRAAKALGLRVQVTFLDLNATMLENARYNVPEEFAGQCSFFHGSCTRGKRGVAVFEEQVDALVSEILGTFSVSESVHIYLKDAVRLVQRHGGVAHVIPQSVAQLAGIYDERVLVAEQGSLAAQHMLPLYRQLRENLRVIVTQQPAYAADEAPRAQILLRRDSFCGACFVGNDASISLDFGPRDILVFEWEAVLWRSVKLSNSMRRSNPARAQAWGIPIAFVLPHTCECNVRASLKIRWPEEASLPKGLVLEPLDAAAKKVLRARQVVSSAELFAGDSDDDAE